MILTIVIIMTIMWFNKVVHMRRRLVWIFNSFLYLLMGALLYALYRQDTGIGKLFGAFLGFSLPVNSLFSKLCAWFLPDFLWMVSLICALFAVWLPTEKGTLFLCGLALTVGVLWETAQYYGVVSGTGDLWDVLMYGIAAVFAAIIKRKSKKEKKV